MHERRQYQRLVPDSPQPVYLGDCGSVLLFDVSEGGIGVDCTAPKNNDPIPLVFDLPNGAGPVRAKAEIAWTSDATNRTGLRFVDLTDLSRQQLREWVASKAYENTAESVSLPLPLTPPESETPSQLVFSQGLQVRFNSLEPEASHDKWANLRATVVSSNRTRGTSVAPVQDELKGNEASRDLWRLRQTLGLALAIVVFVPTFLFLGHLLGSVGHGANATGITAVAKADTPVPTEGSAATAPTPGGSVAVPATVSLDLPGFVLQVGAMNREANADDLRASLEQKSFPAFVFRRRADRFYRVAVGPYNDAGAAAKVKDKLRGAGFEAILKHWSPE